MSSADLQKDVVRASGQPWVDPQMQAILNDAVAIPPTEDIKQLRQASVQSKQIWNDVDLPDGMAVTSDAVTLGGNERLMRVYTPSLTTGTDILFVHGGGWSICNLDTHHAICIALAETTSRRVIALHPRQVPECPYPAPLDDVVAFIGQTQRPLILAGDSAGANLALAAALRLSAGGSVNQVSALVLMYGCYRNQSDTQSHHRFGDGRFGLTSARMQLFWSLYLGDRDDVSFGDLSSQGFGGLPPTYIGAAALDPLLDDSNWLARKLHGSDVAHTARTYDGVVHGFLHYVKGLDAADKAMADISEFLTQHALQ
ncbi:MAG: alpha/beta hydrolase fold domain-containing protein [Pseudomonadota bacterium]